LNGTSESLEEFSSFEGFSQNCGTVNCVSGKIDNISSKAKNIEIIP